MGSRFQLQQNNDVDDAEIENDSSESDDESDAQDLL